MREIRGGIAALIEVFLKDVLRLEGDTEAHIGERTRIHIAEYEGMFSAAQLQERDKDLAAKICRALCRSRVIKELALRQGTPTAAHLQIVLSAIARPDFSLMDR